MAKDLYFLSVIADALRQLEPKAALRVAFEEINALGRQPQYERGFLQFQRFIAEVKRNWERRSLKPEDIALEAIRCLALMVASDLLEGEEDEIRDVLSLIRSQPVWLDEFERIRREASKSEMLPRIPEIIIERNGERIDSIACERSPLTKGLEDVTPGHYAIRLDTGRAIWEEELTQEELIWTAAFPEQALDLAADTGDAAARRTREIILLNGELIVRVFAQTESGRLELKIGDPNPD